MDIIHPALEAVLNTLKSLAPFAPLLALCIVAEKIWAKYPVSNKTIAINLIYVVGAMALAHGLVLQYLYRLNAFVPQNVWDIQLHAALT